MAEDPSKSLFTFKYFIIEGQGKSACSWTVPATGFGMEGEDRVGRRGSSNG
jgi:hypothetical protein